MRNPNQIRILVSERRAGEVERLGVGLAEHVGPTDREHRWRLFRSLAERHQHLFLISIVHAITKRCTGDRLIHSTHSGEALLHKGGEHLRLQIHKKRNSCEQIKSETTEYPFCIGELLLADNELVFAGFALFAWDVRLGSAIGRWLSQAKRSKNIWTDLYEDQQISPTDERFSCRALLEETNTKLILRNLSRTRQLLLACTCLHHKSVMVRTKYRLTLDRNVLDFHI